MQGEARHAITGIANTNVLASSTSGIADVLARFLRDALASRLTPAADTVPAPGSVVCDVETMVASWQASAEPPARGVSTFKVTLYDTSGSGPAPVFSGSFRYPLPPSGIASAGCT